MINIARPDPKAAIIVYGRQHAEGLPQAAWFRIEDVHAAKAGAAEMKLSVIELKTDAEKALATGVHEGVLKGSGRMIVGAVELDVYRRIEAHVGKLPAPATISKGEGPSADAGAAAAKSAEKPAADNSTVAAAAPNPTVAWQSLRVGDSVLALYRNEKKEPEGWWLATVSRIEGSELVLRWPGEPDYPVFRRAPKYVAILHPDFIASGD
jgi:hypothetical protein